MVAGALWTALVVHAFVSPARHSALHELADWSVMVAAMTLPLAAPGTRLVTAASFRSRRRRTALEYAGGFVVAWIAVAAGLFALVYSAGLFGRGGWVLFATAALAVAWQVSEGRRRAVERCCVNIWPPAWGRRADIGAIKAGATSALRCVGVCWAMTLVMAAAPTLPVMGVLFALQRYERRPGPTPFARTRWRRPALGFALLGAAGALAALGVT
jgi:predicted metal-binding membrane protein